MLTELTITNFAIIDDLRLRFAPGFNVLTGETGAGKSIILDAVSLVLGGRADTTMVRAGCEAANLEATFRLEPELQAALAPLIEAEGLEGEAPDLLLLGREVRANGRSICRVNGRTVNLSLLRDLAEPLIDIHGQGEHLSLLRPRAHLPLLDAYAGLAPERKELAREVSRLHGVQRELHALQRDARLLAQRMDMLQFQIQEINAANLAVDEEAELLAERTRLANAEQLAQHAAIAAGLITGVDEETPAISDLLGQVEHSLMQLARLDPTRAPLLEMLRGLNFQLSEVAGELQDYQEALEFNPRRLDFVEERLDLIRLLQRKYGDAIADVLAARDRAVQELEQITHSETRVEELLAEQERLLRRIGALGEALSRKRQAAAERLAAAAVAQLADLNMAGARFAVAFTRKPDPQGAYVDDARVAFDQTGIDQAEFVISANPGEPLKPMVKVASGGETARLMLALKTALAEVDATPTLIFDEIDQGIGGRVGGVVGRKLWGLTAVADHQVIVVTHLPQLAGYGDAHFHVSKHVVHDRTLTAVAHLDLRGRVQELAAMLGTQSDVAVEGAESILRQVAEVKKQKQGQKRPSSA